MASLAITAAVAGVASAAAGAVGSMQAAKAQATNARFQSQVAQNNATIEKQNADYAAKAGQEAATVQSLKEAQTAGAIKASQAANNIDVNSGSAVDVQESQKETGELDTLTVMNNAMLQSYGYNTQATNFSAEAGLQSQQADQAETGGLISAAGGLLGGASSVGFKFSGLSNPSTSGSAAP